MTRIVISICLLSICGCNGMTEAEQLEKNKPIKLAETEGVTLWKVRDSTPGGRVWIYYTTPPAFVSEK